MPEAETHEYGQLSLITVATRVSGERQLFQPDGSGTTGQPSTETRPFILLLF